MLTTCMFSSAVLRNINPSLIYVVLLLSGQSYSTKNPSLSEDQLAKVPLNEATYMALIKHLGILTEEMRSAITLTPDRG